MPGTARRSTPSRPTRSLREDAGFGMIEVLVSMVLLTVLSLATFAVIDNSTKASAQTRSKSIAASIAHDDLNRLRQLKFSLASSASYQSVASQKGVDGVNYQVTSTATWASDSGVETSCTTPTTAGNSQYLRIRSSVTWPNNSGAAIVADSIMAPRGKEANRSTGSLMVKVQDRAAAPVSGATVTVAGQSLVTSAAGCVYFPAINAGQWPVTTSKAATPSNYMDSNGNSPGTATASVVVGDVSTVSESFDIPANFSPITLAYENGTVGAKWTSISLAGQAGTIAGPTGTSRSTFTSGNVFPFASGWTFYAGNCAGNSPAQYSGNFTANAPNSSIIAAPGATAAAGRAYMKTVKFTIRNLGLYAQAYTWRIYPIVSTSQMSGCTESVTGTTAVISQTTGTANVQADLPYGIWQICAAGTSYASSSSRYSYWKSAPYNAMPNVSGTTLKPTAPANSPADLGTVGTTQGSGTDQCPAFTP